MKDRTPATFAAGGFPIWQGCGPTCGLTQERSRTAVPCVGSVSPSQELLRSTPASTQERGPSSAASVGGAFQIAPGSASIIAQSTACQLNTTGRRDPNQRDALRGVQELCLRPAVDLWRTGLQLQILSVPPNWSLLTMGGSQLVETRAGHQQKEQAVAERSCPMPARIAVCVLKTPRPGIDIRPWCTTRMTAGWRRRIGEKGVKMFRIKTNELVSVPCKSIDIP